MNLGETIYRLRIEKNMSQWDLAEALGVSRPASHPGTACALTSD